MPFFSIIVPTFNSSKTIFTTLNSLIKQSCIDFEVIIQDNLSNDSTIEIIAKLKKEFSERLIIYSEPDTGIYDAMNMALKRCNGNWIIFLGSGDYLIDKDVLADVYSYILDNKSDLVYGNVNSPDYGSLYDGEFDLGKLAKKNICHQSIFYSRKVFDLLGYFDLRYKVLADWDFNLKCFIHPSIKVQHYPRIISFFAPGGFSTSSIDNNFGVGLQQRIQTYRKAYKRRSFFDYLYFLKLIRR